VVFAALPPPLSRKPGAAERGMRFDAKHKKLVASDMTLATIRSNSINIRSHEMGASKAKPKPSAGVRFGEEEQRSERALTLKSRSKRYTACSDVYQRDKRTIRCRPCSSAANPVKRIAAESEEQQNERGTSFDVKHKNSSQAI